VAGRAYAIRVSFLALLPDLHGQNSALGKDRFWRGVTIGEDTR
jgi:hypothetical protein